MPQPNTCECCANTWLAVAKVSPELLDAEAPAEWPKIVAMRNLLAHQHADLDQEILQKTIDNRLDDFTQLIDRLHAVAIANERPMT